MPRMTGAEPLDLAWKLRVGQCVSDAQFDQLFPRSVQDASCTFWTPVSVALRAARLLVDEGATRILDVGSGVGKFCIVGAAATGAMFVGVEHRERFVREARDAAHLAGVRSAEFVHGTMEVVDVLEFDAIYLFNPFEENLWHSKLWLDHEVELSRGRFVADVAQAERMLDRARPGTRVATYFGFGGQMPNDYGLVLQERTRWGPLDLWIKKRKLG